MDPGGATRRRLRALRADNRIVVIDTMRRFPDPSRRVEAPAERAIQYAVPWKESIKAPEWIPIPARPIPSAVGHNSLRRLDIGLRFILAPQLAPAVQQIAFNRV